MATLREYFDTDLKCMSQHKPWEIKSVNGDVAEPIIARISQDFDANAKYWSFFISEESDVMGYIQLILGMRETAECILGPEGDGIFIETGFSDYSERASSATLLFTKRIFLYVDHMLNKLLRDQIKQAGSQHGFHVIVRDKEYAMKRSELEKPLAFISHDSRDKDSIVRELAHELSGLMCPVWYDEYSLNVGDSLRSSIELGLKETRKCVVVLSKNFLANDGWGKAEFDSVYTREIIEKNNVILPIWHDVSVEDVYAYSPRLADKVGLNSSLGVKELARKLAGVIKNENT
ncbi:toll/interleukin-1 receptor domain-containing protein [Vibrio splendidus]